MVYAVNVRFRILRKIQPNGPILELTLLPGVALSAKELNSLIFDVWYVMDSDNGEYVSDSDIDIIVYHCIPVLSQEDTHGLV